MNRHLRPLLRQAKKRDRVALLESGRRSVARSFVGFRNALSGSLLRFNSYTSLLARVANERESEQLKRSLIAETGGDPDGDAFKHLARHFPKPSEATLRKDYGGWIARIAESMKP
jgi:hypothetical protein